MTSETQPPPGNTAPLRRTAQQGNNPRPPALPAGNEHLRRLGGQRLVLKQRIKWHGYTPELLEYNVGDEFPDDVDIIVGGGGQDSGQLVIQDDLQARATQLKQLADEGAPPMLVICGLYQLFGKFFKTSTGPVIPGIGILDVETHGTDERLIGNVTMKSAEFGDILGYENHSGQTTLGPGVEPSGLSRKAPATTARTDMKAPVTTTS